MMIFSDFLTTAFLFCQPFVLSLQSVFIHTFAPVKATLHVAAVFLAYFVLFQGFTFQTFPELRLLFRHGIGSCFFWNIFLGAGAVLSTAT